MYLARGRMDKLRKAGMARKEKVNENSNFFDICCNSWVVRALNVAIAPLLITAMGGILRSNEAINEIGTMVAGSSFPSILIPFLPAAII